MRKYRREGIILFNNAKLPDGFKPANSRTYCVPASEIADTLGTTKATNMVMLGALLELTHTLPKETAFAVLKAKVHNLKLLEVDYLAIEAGMECIRNQQITSLADAHTHEIELTHTH